MKKKNDPIPKPTPEKQTASLLPCPWCRPAPEVLKYNAKEGPHVCFLGFVTDFRGQGFTLGYSVRCGYCGSQGPNASNPSDAEDFWNERSSPSENAEKQRA